MHCTVICQTLPERILTALYNCDILNKRVKDRAANVGVILKSFFTPHKETPSSAQQGAGSDDNNFPPYGKVDSEPPGGCWVGVSSLKQ